MSIYLDHNATTPVDPVVLEAMRPYFSEAFGNPSSVHGPGQQARAALDEARRTLAGVLGCSSSELIFTSGGTEADNTALLGLGRALGSGGHVVISAIEHHAVLDSAEVLEEMGMRVDRVMPGPDGIIDPAALEEAMEKDTVLVALMLANNETGALQPVAEAARIAHGRGALIHCDAVQALGKVPVDLVELDVDTAALTGHKIYGPKGIGALYIREGTPFAPLIHGGGQEYGRRGGTVNVPLAVGLAEAARLAAERLEEEADLLRGWTGRFLDALTSGLGEDAFVLHGPPEPAQRLPNTLNLGFRGVRSDELVQALDLAGLSVSAGSACQAGAVEPTHVLEAMSVSEETARGAIRFSFGRSNDDEQVEAAARITVDVVGRLAAGEAGA